MQSDDRSSLRRCARCSESKPLSAFYYVKRASGKSRYGAYCRPCVTAAHREWRTKNRERVLDGERRWRAENSEHLSEQTRQWRARNPEAFAASSRAWKVRNPERIRIQQRASFHVQQALKQGTLVRPSTCATCGKGGSITAAHNDYSRPLDVRWLCRSCHSRWDRAEPKTLPHD
jgi:hypothetical protein